MRIGITSSRSNREYTAKHKRHYIQAIRALGAEPVILAPDVVSAPASAVAIKAFTAELDGLILSGGGDIHPRHYGEPMIGTETRDMDEDLDQLELAVIGAALETPEGGLPLFAICRGMQVLNVALGGKLIQHLPEHRPSVRAEFRGHPVWVQGGSRLARAMDAAGEVPTNSYHHQGVDAGRLAPCLRPVAWAVHDPWLIESYESPDYRWLVGVQWHPERWYELPAVHWRLFASFLGACRNGRAYRE